MIVTISDEHTGYGNSYGSGALIPGFTSLITSVPTSSLGSVSVTLEYFGDFDIGPANEFLSVDIEGIGFGPYTGDQYDGAFGPAFPSTVTFSIDEATWRTIIQDGQINIAYTLGSGANNLSDAPGAEEFIKLAFTWDTLSTPPTPPSIITGTDGDDHLPGTARNDTILGNKGDDGLYGKEGNDTLEGGAGNDSVYGAKGNDQLHGQAADDRVFGGQGIDKIYGEMGDDTLGGGQGNDQIWGGMGDDILYGGDNDDLLDGGIGNDVLFGGSGADTLWGGTGNDTLFGGGGPDLFGFSANSGSDIIYGFEQGDEIDLDGQSFTADLDADGDLVLSLSGGGTITLFGISALDQGWFV